MTPRITSKTLKTAIEELAASDPDIARAYATVGVPPLRRRPPGFSSLLRIICTQQISTAAAQAILGRLDDAVGILTPQAFLALTDDDLRRIGFSRSKAAYGRELSQCIIDGRLDLKSVAAMDDEVAVKELTRVKGIGRWTAEIYLLFALGRPDVWPIGDLAVVEGLTRLKGLKRRPKTDEMQALGDAWKPWRSVAARLLWRYYGQVPKG